MASSQSGAARSARERVAGRITVLHAALLTFLAGALFYFLVPEGRILVLFFLFLPVVAGSAQLGARKGLALGALGVALVLIPVVFAGVDYLSLIHISEPTRLRRISYAVFCL